MARRLPPLNALRAVEAGARHLSFTKAAEELHVTQAAVSHQVKALEEHLGVRLFRRLTRRLALTEEGRALLPAVGEAFDRIAEAAERIGRSASRSRTLTVSVTPSFGAKWLVHRLGRFWREHPDVDLRVHHSVQLVDFDRDSDVDLAVRWGRGGWPGLSADLLIPSGRTPVCSPALLDGPHPLRTPDDLRHHTLLHEDDYGPWIEWLMAAGAAGVDARRGPIIDDAGVVVQLAIDGHGVALGRVGLIAGDLAAGRLVRPFDLSLEDSLAYYLVCPPRNLTRPRVKAFRDFLLAEAAREREEVGGGEGGRKEGGDGPGAPLPRGDRVDGQPGERHGRLPRL